MVLQVSTVNSLSEYREGYHQKNDQHVVGVSLVTYSVMNFLIVFVGSGDGTSFVRIWAIYPINKRIQKKVKR